MRHPVLSRFSEPTRSWFTSSFAEPTPAQSGAWDTISSGGDALVVAPTGSGKTLAAFLWAIDELARAPEPAQKERLKVLYVSPLKALAVDVERNLRSPLRGIQAAAERSGGRIRDISVAIRTGDTPQDERRRFATHPPDILITTPESLFLLLTSRAREAMTSIDTVIVDEVHAVAGTKRGAHLALSLERLDHLTGRRARRIGLSATVRPVEEIARWLGGEATRVVAPPAQKRMELTIEVPVEDLSILGESTAEPASGDAAGVEERTSIWPHVEERLLSLVRDHKSTIIFANSRRLSERLCSRLNDLAGEEVVRAHHGSVAREQRLTIEEDLKAGRLPAVVATSSLELGIDMAEVDLVVQVEAPPSVAAGLQRVGRAGHQVGAVSRGVIFPKFRGDLLEAAVVAERMQARDIESIRTLRNPLDVLAQQIVAMVAMDDWEVDELEDLVRRAAPFSELPRNALEAVLDMLAGRYPSDEFAELRPRLTWDRVAGTLTGRRGAQRLAVTSGGTIPDRGLYGVFLATEGGGRVGELDEEMVYESRPGETFVLGATTWLIEDITYDRVLVSPAPGRPGKMPFWHGDAPGRPIELGRAHGAFLREIVALPAEEADVRLGRAGLDVRARANLLAYLEEQKEATGVLPDDRTIVIERFRDELGDWRICIHSPFGARVHAPWSLAIQARVRERLGVEVQSIYSDDGIVVRVPEADDAPPTESVLFDPEEIEDAVVAEVGSSAFFAGRFRECAARSLLLPKRRPGSRQPLWQQRQKSHGLLQAAGKYPDFPVVLEAFRECLQDVFDLPALVTLMSEVAQRKVRIVAVDTSFPSPFAGSLLFGFVSAFMYEGDAPLAERRAQALALDRGLLSELLGREELRELIDQAALAELELELQRLVPERKARDADELHDLLRSLGDLSRDGIAARSASPGDPSGWIEGLVDARRAIPLRISGEERFAAIEDAARFRDGLGSALPAGVPAVFLEPVGDPVGDLVARYARTHGPFLPEDIAARLGLGTAVVCDALGRLAEQGRVLEGEFRPEGLPGGREWIDADVLRRLKRRSLAAFRREVEPVPQEDLARFAGTWNGIAPAGEAGRRASEESLYEVVETLAGVPLPASQLERLVLARRLDGYTPDLLDRVMASGEVVWAGAGAAGSDDGWVVLSPAADAPLLLPEPAQIEPAAPAGRLLAALEDRGALFFRALADAAGSTDDTALTTALWDLVWAGLITNDTLAPLRAVTRMPARTGRRRRRAPLPLRGGPPQAAGRWALVERPVVESTRRMHALAGALLTRHGVLTRGAVSAEGVPGGFSGLYPVLTALEDAGRCRRGYFVEGLGGAQFALPGAVDRMRSSGSGADNGAVLLAAADPANPYGAALPWPERTGTHRAGRKAGAVVLLWRGRLAVYLEKGARSALVYLEDDDALGTAARALVAAAARGSLPGGHLTKIEGATPDETTLGRHLLEAGARQTSRGIRLA